MSSAALLTSTVTPILSIKPPVPEDGVTLMVPKQIPGSMPAEFTLTESWAGVMVVDELAESQFAGQVAVAVRAGTDNEKATGWPEAPICTTCDRGADLVVW